MDAIVLLKTDHKTVEGMFKQFEKAGDTAYATKKKLITTIITELTTHAFVEETIFYPAARTAVPATTDHVLESIEEHHVMAWLLAELGKLKPTDETYTAKATVLIENVRHHVREEEDDWFPQVRKALSRKDLVALGDRMEAAKANAPKDPLALSSATA
jgi:hemerythrin superfamily protein